MFLLYVLLIFYKGYFSKVALFVDYKCYEWFLPLFSEPQSEGEELGISSPLIISPLLLLLFLGGVDG